MSFKDKNLHTILLCAVLVVTSAFLHCSQFDQKQRASLSNVMIQSDRNSGKDEIFKKYVRCIDNLKIFPTVLAQLIVGYTYKKIKLSHDKVIFRQGDPMQLISSMLLDSRYLVTASPEDGNIKFWDYKEECYMHIIGKHDTPITVLTELLNPSDLFASGSRDGTVKIWNFRKGKCLHALKGHTKSVDALVGLPSGNIISAADDAVKIWNSVTGACLETLKRPNRDKMNHDKINPVVSLIPISNDRVDEVSTKNISKLIIYQEPERLTLYDIDNSNRLMRIHYHSETHDIRCATRGDDNILIATTEPCLKIFDIRHGKHTGSIALEYQPICLAYRDGFAFVGNAIGSIDVVDMATKSCIQKLYAHDYEGEKDYSISSIIPLDNGSIIASCVRGCMHLFKEKVDKPGFAVVM
jgi:WD40 repeat protein